MEGLVVLSLFDGMSCGRIALDRLKIPVKYYFASEIDKFAIQVSREKWPATIHKGSVKDISAYDLPKVDLLIGGSPCQGFSNSGKGLNFDDPHSALFFEYVRILKECRAVNPDVKWLLENVRMKKEWEDTISRILEIQPICINSALVSAQNRERLYWTNISTAQRGLFGDTYCTIPQPKDKKIYLKDVLQPTSEVDEKYYISDKGLARILRKTYSNPKVDPDKAGTLDTKNNSGQLSGNSGTTGIQEPREFTIPDKSNAITANHAKKTETDYFEKGRGQMVPVFVTHNNGEFKETDKALCIDANYFKGMDNHGQITMVREPGVIETTTIIDGNGIPKDDVRKSSTFTAGAHSAGNHSDMDLLVQRTVIQVNPSTESGGVQPYQQNRIYSPEGIAPALAAELGGERQIMIVVPEPVIISDRGASGEYIFTEGKVGALSSKRGCSHDNFIFNKIPQADRIYETEDKSVTLGARNGGLGAGVGLYNIKERIRRLTPLEVCRLQTVQDDYFFTDGKQIVSDSQIYKMCGNGWTVDAICHILSYLPIELLKVNGAIATK